MVIKEANLPSEMRRVIMSFEEQAGQAATQPQNLPLIPVGPKRTTVERIETVIKAAAPKRTETDRTQTLVIETQADVIPISKATLYLLQCQIQPLPLLLNTFLPTHLLSKLSYC